MLFNLLKNLWLYFSTYWKDSGYGFQLVENILAMVFNLLKKFWLCFSTCWKIYGYAFQPVEKNLAMLFNFWKVIFYEFQVSEKFSSMVFRAWKVQKSLTVSLSSGHAEQLLFSCLGSKVTVYSRKLQCFFLPHPHHPIHWH